MGEIVARPEVDALRQSIPGAAVVFTDSNADSAVRLLSGQDEAAAVVPVDYREPPEQSLHSFALQTAAHNATRFIAIKRAPADPQPDFTREKLSALITARANRPGVLYEILGAFQRNNLNLTRIESRPVGDPWEYVFLLDVAITPATSRARSELRQAE